MRIALRPRSFGTLTARMPALGWSLLAFLVFLNPVARAEDPPRPSLTATQVTVHQGRKQYRASVVGKQADRLILVTAAHCVSVEEAELPVTIHQADRVLAGRVLAIAQNPDYRPIASRDPGSSAVRGVLCVDSAIATVQVNLRSDRDSQTFAAIEPAEMVARAPNGGTTRAITVHIIDQTGTEHVVKAGNHLNPKCLAWGRNGYRPVPGDSGAGVFYFLHATAEEREHPVLIGNVALADDRGGIAPLLGRNLTWIEGAVNHSQPVQNH